MTLLDKLQELETSPGPWRVTQGFRQDGVMEFAVLTDGDKNLSLTASELYEADAKLASLAPFIVKLVKRLEACVSLLEGYDASKGELHAVRHAHSVLKELEEALG